MKTPTEHHSRTWDTKGTKYLPYSHDCQVYDLLSDGHDFRVQYHKRKGNMEAGLKFPDTLIDKLLTRFKLNPPTQKDRSETSWAEVPESS